MEEERYGEIEEIGEIWGDHLLARGEEGVRLSMVLLQPLGHLVVWQHAAAGGALEQRGQQHRLPGRAGEAVEGHVKAVEGSWTVGGRPSEVH